jgi:hypothetical protein
LIQPYWTLGVSLVGLTNTPSTLALGGGGGGGVLVGTPFTISCCFYISLLLVHVALYLWHHNCGQQEHFMADVFLEVSCGDSVTMLLLLLLFLTDATFFQC